jgi:hypothetical protein
VPGMAPGSATVSAALGMRTSFCTKSRIG